MSPFISIISQAMIEGRESTVQQLLDCIEGKLKSNSVFVSFQEFQLIQYSIEAESAENIASLLQRYEGLAFEYLRKLIEYAHVPQKNYQTRRSFSYFFEEAFKIVNTNHFPFYNTLLEINFIDFLRKLQKDVKGNGEYQLARRFDDLIRDNELCSLLCVGCNTFYYQYFPFQMNVTKRTYELIFLRSITQEMKSNAFTKPQAVKESLGLAIDLLHLEDSTVLLKQIVFVLNNNGGFIIVGCKKIQDFHTIQQSYTPNQLVPKYMNAQFVIGESLTQQRKNRINEGLYKLIKKITPYIEAQQNITISFVPIKPSLFELGFDLQTLKFDNQAFQKKEMHLVVIKIDPTLPNYNYQLNLNSELQCEKVDTEMYVQYIQKQADIDAYLKQMREGMSEEEELEEAFCLQPQLSYFQSHQDCHFQPFSS